MGLKKNSILTSIGYQSGTEDMTFLDNLAIGDSIARPQGLKSFHNSTTPDSYKKLDLMIFGDDGESVVHPKYYVGSEDDCRFFEDQNEYSSSRDMSELAQMEYCLNNKVKMIGIGRAAMMMCAAAGGQIVQSVIGHRNNNIVHYDQKNRPHNIYGINSIINDWPSNHSQMMYPFVMDRKDYSILGFSLSESTYEHPSSHEKDDMPLVPYYKLAGGKDLIPPTRFDFLRSDKLESKSNANNLDLVEPDVVYFRNLGALAFTGDPNMIDPDNKEALAFVNEIIELFLTDRL